MKKAVILGGNNLSKYLSKELKKKNYKIFHLIRNEISSNQLSNTVIIKSFNLKSIENKLNSIRPDLIINLINTRDKNLAKCIKINTVIPINIISWVIKNNSFLVLIGSSSEYGNDSKKKKMTENFCLIPDNSYGFSKYILSSVVHSYNKIFHNKILHFRIFNISGDILNRDTLVGKVNYFINKNKNKNKTLHLGNLSSYRDYIDIKVVAKIVVKMINKKEGGVFNLGSGKPILVRKLIQKMFNKYKNLSFTELNNKFHNNETQYIYADLKKLKKILNEKN